MTDDLKKKVQSDGGALPSRLVDTSADDGGAVLQTAVQIAAKVKGPILLSEKQSGGGIGCPNCGCKRSRDPDGPGWEKAKMAIAKTQQKSGAVHRHRVCSNCGCRVTTCERIVGEPRMPKPKAKIRLSDM